MILALALAAAAWYWQSWLLLAAAAFTAYEALVGWCVVYQLLGRNTCPMPPPAKDAGTSSTGKS